MKKEHRIAVEVGDWSRDGHNQSEIIYYICTADEHTLEMLYAEGTKILGVDLVEDICANYEECYIRDENILAVFLEHGIIDADWIEDDEMWVEGPDNWAEMYMRICNLGNVLGMEKFAYALSVEPRTLKIGGYGLFVD